MATVIHTYFTDGLFGWAELFLGSLKKQHGTKNLRVLVSSRDLSKKQIKKLYTIYPNIKVLNKKIDLKMVANRAGVDVPTIIKWKYEVEHGTPIYGSSDIWKKYVSVEDRYRNSILEAFSLCNKGDHILHCDIDTYFRGELYPLFKLIKKNDISIRFRHSTRSIGKRVLACMIGFRVSNKSRKFMGSWIKKIDSVPLPEKTNQPRFSQVMFYKTYLEFKNTLSWGNIPIRYASPKRQKNFKVWNSCIGDADEVLKLCYKDFNE